MAEISKITQTEIINGAMDKYLYMFRFREDSIIPTFWYKLEYKAKIELLSEALSKGCIMTDTDVYKSISKNYESNEKLHEDSDTTGMGSALK